MMSVSSSFMCDATLLTLFLSFLYYKLCLNVQHEPVLYLHFLCQEQYTETQS